MEKKEKKKEGKTKSEKRKRKKKYIVKNSDLTSIAMILFRGYLFQRAQEYVTVPRTANWLI